MILAELLDGIIEIPSTLDSTIEIKGIALDNRKIKKSYLFLALLGEVTHGLKYAQQAIENGANIIIYDIAGSEKFSLDALNCKLLKVKNLSLIASCIASRFYYSPSQKLNVIGITGTNGKTTCSQFLAQIIPDCGVIGTLGWGDQLALKNTLNTTPDALASQEILADFIVSKKKTVVMEISSHGLQQGRVNAINFKGAVFTNLSQDHLDYHGSMNDYLKAKLILFSKTELQFAVINADDKNYQHFLDATHYKVKKWAFSATGKKIEAIENVTAENIDYSLSGIKFLVNWRNNKTLIQTKIVGDFNLHNILTVITVLLATGSTLKSIAYKMNKLMPIKGRMEYFGDFEKPTVFVDFAHTPDALKKVLQGLRSHCKHKLYLVFGCGGNRDKSKRLIMGAIAEKYADQVIITDDNPRFEGPKEIISDIEKGFLENKYHVIQNRKRAIQMTIQQAEKTDCIVIAGKGHEEYQEIKGVKHFFSDQEIVQQELLKWVDQT